MPDLIVTVRQLHYRYGTTVALDCVDLTVEPGECVQQQRLQLAMALVGDPDLLVLDEPTAGLDAPTRREAWRILRDRRDRGTAILLTTHIIDEATAVADRVVVLHDGRVVANDHPRRHHRSLAEPHDPGSHAPG